MRVLKFKSIKKEQEHDDPILSLSILKNEIPYSTIIRDIGYDRFFVHYWSAIQMNAHRKYAKQSKTPLISIDATGGVVRKPVPQVGNVMQFFCMKLLYTMDKVNFL